MGTNSFSYPCFFCSPFYYLLNVSKSGYLFYSDNFSFEGIYHFDKPFVKDIPMQPIQSGQTIVLRNIFFEFDAYSLLPESEVELNKVVDFLNENHALSVEIGGHTDAKGSESYNQSLSENRAKAVVNFLISKGIKAQRLHAKGYGATQPIA